MSENTWWVVCLADKDEKMIAYVIKEVGDFVLPTPGIARVNESICIVKDGVRLEMVWVLGPYPEDQATNLVKGFERMPTATKIKMLTEVPKGPTSLGGKK
jgi:hypothetical protein